MYVETFLIFFAGVAMLCFGNKCRSSSTLFASAPESTWFNTLRSGIVSKREANFFFLFWGGQVLYRTRRDLIDKLQNAVLSGHSHKTNTRKTHFRNYKKGKIFLCLRHRYSLVIIQTVVFHMWKFNFQNSCLFKI